MLKPLDILVSLKVFSLAQEFGPEGRSSSLPVTFEALGNSVGVSASQAHTAARNAVEAGILNPEFKVRSRSLYEVLLASRYYLSEKVGGPTRGYRTSFAADVLSPAIVFEPGFEPVWAHPEGNHFGLAVEPIYKTAPLAAIRDTQLYKLLALVDALRIGRAREVEMASAELKQILGVPNTEQESR